MLFEQDPLFPVNPEPHTCFLCGHRIVFSEPVFYQEAHEASLPAPAHSDCVHGRDQVEVAQRYHQFVADTVNVPRALQRALGHG